MATEFHYESGLVHLSQSKCAFIVVGESSYGACDQVECGVSSEADCASHECVNSPCFDHAGFCWVCHEYFCRSYDKALETCFSQHLSAGPCCEAVRKAPLAALFRHFHSGRDEQLETFVKYNSDGLGNALPTDVVINLALGVAYEKNLLPQFKEEMLTAHKNRTRKRRTERQKVRRAAKRLGLSVPPPLQHSYVHLAPHRNSTIHIATGALLVRQWTKSWHYREQTQMLKIMGLYRSEDFVRNKLDYLQNSNPHLYAKLDFLATSVLPRRRRA
jgi:hypothetical protein